MKNVFYLFLVYGCLLFSCNDTGLPSATKIVDPQPAAVLEEGNLNMVVTMPAGTARILYYDRLTDRYELAKDTAGQELPPTFMPAPGNLGFLPGTAVDSLQLPPLEILLLGEGKVTGSLIAVQPIGGLRLREEGIESLKIIAIPLQADQQIVPVDNFLDFAIRQEAAKQIVETWFLNYRGFRSTDMLGWEDEFYVMQLVKKRLAEQR